MIASKETAKQIVDLMLQTGARIDESVALVQAQGSAQDLANYRRAAGAVMGEILIEVLNPLFKEHPELRPPQLAPFTRSGAKERE